ncbi:MAG: flagellar motor switch protein FliM [Rhodospirillales bacterium]|nr:flagellar motor switch protein FliM [Rhodospirillales bacterium]
MTSPTTLSPEANDPEAMAAEWERQLAAEAGNSDAAAADDDDDADDHLELTIDSPPEQPARVLNQDEIDSLLGLGGDSDEQERPQGIEAVLNSGLVSYERLPMLEVVVDRLLRLMSASLRKFTHDNVEVSLDTMVSTRFGDYLNGVALPAILCVVKAVEWDNFGLVTIDSSLVYSTVDVLLGGRRGTAAMRIEGRPYTTVERSLVERLVQVVLQDLSAAFAPISDVTFRLERMETNPRFATISRPSNAAILTRLRIDMEDRGGAIEIFLPYATLEPVRELLLQMFMGEKFGHDSIWENHLVKELWFTEVEVTAIMGEQTLPLREVMNLEKGSLVVFNAQPDSTIQLECNGVPMFSAKMGRNGNRLAVRVEDRTKRKKKGRKL